MSERRGSPALWVALGLAGLLLLLSCGAGVAWIASSEHGQKFIDAAGG